jgi:hypothetical protein
MFKLVFTCALLLCQASAERLDPTKFPRVGERACRSVQRVCDPKALLSFAALEAIALHARVIHDGRPIDYSTGSRDEHIEVGVAILESVTAEPNQTLDQTLGAFAAGLATPWNIATGRSNAGIVIVLVKNEHRAHVWSQFSFYHLFCKVEI